MMGAVVDPGGDLDKVEKVIKDQGVTLEKIIITHGHMDHAGGAATLAERFGVPIEGPHPEDQFLIDELENQGKKYGLPDAKSFTPTRWLDDGDQVTVGNNTLDIYHCPGHTPGHVVLHNKEHNIALVGDVLFQGSVGRTDFPRGDHATLIKSITEKLWPLGNETTFISGHGPLSTFGQERQTNPFVGDAFI
jgi:glyoxylase-like metal-dependent hydrolase (beta-lactamase superfamily II)